MKDSQLPSEELSHIDYRFRTLFKLKWILLFFLLFALGFLLTYPTQEKINQSLKKILQSNSNCPIHFKNISYGFFPPAINIHKVLIPSRCSQGSLKNLNISSINLNFAGISFSPLGMAINTQINIPQNPLKAKAIIGFGQQAIKMDRNPIRLKVISQLFKEPYKLQGLAHLSSRLIFSDQILYEGEIRIQSKNFNFPPQNIKGFDTPSLNLKHIDIIADIPSGGSRYLLNTMNIGSPTAPLRLKGQGVIKPDQRNFNNSQLNLKLEVSPSQALNQEFPLLETLLQSYNNKDGFYRIGIQGSINAPKVKSF